MKLSCLQENLAKGLSIVGRSVATRSTLPVLSNVLLATDGDRLKLSATNLEIGIVCLVGAKVEVGGSITVPARTLTDFVGSLPHERIDMELSGHTLNLKCARFEANIKGMDAQEFPLIPTVGEDSKISLDSSLLRQMIDRVVFAAASDDRRPILAGVLARFQGNTLTLAAADGFRLSVVTGALQEPVKKPVEAIIPARALSELRRIIRGEGPVEVTITPARTQALFHTGDVDLVSQLIAGNFPDYTQIIPKSHATRTVVSTGDFLKAAKTVNIFADAEIAKLTITDGHVSMSARSAEAGDGKVEFDTQEVEGDSVEIAFNAKYLIEALGAVGTDWVVLETKTASSPGVIKPVGEDGFTHVLMPMNITR